MANTRILFPIKYIIDLLSPHPYTLRVFNSLWCVKYYNLSSGDSYRFFYIPHNWQIKDHKNLNICFSVDVNRVLYEASLDIPTLNTKTGQDKVNFMLGTENGNTIPAVFTWDLHMTI